MKNNIIKGVIALLIVLLTVLFVTYDNNGIIDVETLDLNYLDNEMSMLSKLNIEEHIVSEFEKHGLIPWGDENSFYQNFDVTTPIKTKDPSISVYDKNKNLVLKISGEEQLFAKAYSINSGEIKSKVNIVDNLIYDKFEGDVVLYNGRVDHSIIRKLEENNVKVIISPIDEEVDFQKGILKRKKFTHYLINRDSYEKLASLIKNTDNNVTIHNTITYKHISGKNIIGLRKGTDDGFKNDLLIISVAYDNISSDENKKAVANFLNIIKNVSDANLKRPILFIAFDQEDTLSSGSRYYYSHKKYFADNISAINIECCVGESGIKIVSSNINNDLNSILSRITDILKKQKTPYITEKLDGEFLSNGLLENIDNSIGLIDIGDDLNLNYSKSIVEYINDYQIKTKDLYDCSFSARQKTIAKDFKLPILISVLLFIASIFVIKKFKKSDRFRKKVLSKAPFTILFLIITAVLIFTFNNYLWEDNINENAKIAPLSSVVKIKGLYENILDMYVDENITIAFKDEKGLVIKKYNYYGDEIEKERVQNSTEISDCRVIKNKVYYKKDTSVYVYQKGEEKILLEDIQGYEVLGHKSDSYVVAYNKNNLICVTNGATARYKELKNIKYAQFDIDKTGDIHAICLVDNYLSHIKFNSKKEEMIINTIQEGVDFKKFDFAIDDSYGYIVFDNAEDKYYGSFKLKNEKAFEFVNKKLEVHDMYDALLKLYTDVNFNKNTNEGSSIKAVASGRIFIGKDYVMSLEFKDGNMIKETEVYATDGEKITEPNVFTYNSNDYYIFMKENKAIIKSTDKRVGENIYYRKLLNRIFRVLQSVVITFIVFLNQILWLLPGILYFAILLLTKNMKHIENPYNSLIPIALTVAIELITFNLGHLFEYQYDYIIVCLVIVVFSALITLFNVYEKGNKSSVWIYFKFSILNIFLIASIYTPYIYKCNIENF